MLENLLDGRQGTNETNFSLGARFGLFQTFKNAV